MYYVNELSIERKVNVTDIVGISSTGYILISGVSFFIFVFGFFGNMLVVYGCKKHSIFKMLDPLTATCLETIAAVDMIIVLMFSMPMYVTMVGNRWIMGSEMCWLIAHFRTLPLYTEINVTATMSVNRAVIIKQPNKSSRKIWSSPYLRAIPLIGTFVIGAVPSIMFLLLRSEAYFEAYFMSCVTSKYLNRGLGFLNTVVMVVFVVLPILLIITSNSYILMTVIRSNKRTRTSTTRTVYIILAVSWTFALSYAHFPIFTALNYYGILQRTWIPLLSVYLASANLVINPIIYFFVCPPFRRFVSCAAKSDLFLRGRKISGDVSRTTVRGFRDVTSRWRPSDSSAAGAGGGGGRSDSSVARQSSLGAKDTAKLFSGQMEEVGCQGQMEEVGCHGQMEEVGCHGEGKVIGGRCHSQVYKQMRPVMTAAGEFLGGRKIIPVIGTVC